MKNVILADGIEIAGLLEIAPHVFADERGCFFESYNARDFNNLGIAETFVQDNESHSAQGALRGLHFQTRRVQAKLVRVVSGRVYDVAVDLRNESATFGKHFGVVLDGEKKNALFIPKGFAHGFYVLSDAAIFSYKCSDFYDAQSQGGIIWNDETLAIDWSAAGANGSPILSEKDTRLPAFDKSKRYFSLDGEWMGE